MKTGICIIVGFFAYLFAQGQTMVFNRAYDNDSTIDGANTVIQTLDGGFLICGSSEGDVFVVKTSNNGETVWKKYIDPNPGPYASNISAAIQLNDSSYILCGFTKDTFLTVRPDLLLLKLDKDGNSLWLKNFDNGWNDYGDDVIQTADGGFIILGTTWDSTANGFNTNAWLIKTDSSGIIEWDTTYGGDKDDVPEALIMDDDGGYVFAGYTKSYGDGVYNDTWIFKASSNGDSLWQSVIVTNGNPDGVWDIEKTLDGGFVFAGGQYVGGVQFGYILKTDSMGIKEWDKTYGNPDGYVSSITQLTDSTYVVSGSTYYTPTNINGWLMKVDKTGKEIWSKYYTHYGGNYDDYVYDMKPTTDGGFIMAGMVMGGGVFKQDMWLVKTDCRGYADSAQASQPPQAGFTDSVKGFTVYLTNTSIDACDFWWYFGDGDSSISINPTHTYSDTGMYIITLIAWAGNRSDTLQDTIWIKPSGMEKEGFRMKKVEVELFPNPFSNKAELRIQHAGLKAGNFRLVIFNLLGDKVLEMSIVNNQSEINRGGLPGGIYFYQIISKNEIAATGKLVISD